MGLIVLISDQLVCVLLCLLGYGWDMGSDSVNS